MVITDRRRSAFEADSPPPNGATTLHLGRLRSRTVTVSNCVSPVGVSGCEGTHPFHHCTTGQEPARGGAVLRRSRGPTRRCEAERAPGTPLGLSTAWRGRVWRVARRVAPPGARRSGRRGRALEAGVKAPAAALRCAAGGDGSLLVSCSGACSGRCVRCVAARLRAGRSVVRRSGRAGCGRGALRGGLRFVRARGPGPVRTAAPRGTSLPHVRGLHARTPPRARRLPQQADSVADTTQPPPVAVLPCWCCWRCRRSLALSLGNDARAWCLGAAAAAGAAGGGSRAGRRGGAGGCGRQGREPRADASRVRVDVRLRFSACLHTPRFALFGRLFFNRPLSDGRNAPICLGPPARPLSIHTQPGPWRRTRWACAALQPRRGGSVLPPLRWRGLA